MRDNLLKKKSSIGETFLVLLGFWAQSGISTGSPEEIFTFLKYLFFTEMWFSRFCPSSMFVRVFVSVLEICS